MQMDNWTSRQSSSINTLQPCISEPICTIVLFSLIWREIFFSKTIQHGSNQYRRDTISIHSWPVSLPADECRWVHAEALCESHGDQREDQCRWNTNDFRCTSLRPNRSNPLAYHVSTRETPLCRHQSPSNASLSLFSLHLHRHARSNDFSIHIVEPFDHWTSLSKWILSEESDRRCHVGHYDHHSPSEFLDSDIDYCLDGR